MTSALSLVDEYNRQARLYPSLLAVLPPLLATLAWFPSLLTSNLGTTLVTLASSCGILFGLSVFSRSYGKRTEARLLRVWGGWPTTQWLRHADGHLVALTKLRYHRALMRRLPEIHMPSADEDRRDPANADYAYELAVGWLKEYCRKGDFPLVVKENIEYGFRRNARGIRPFAIAASGLAFALSVAAIIYGVADASAPSVEEAIQQIPMSIVGATLLLLIALVGWFSLVTDAWVRQAGDQYARALLAACETL
jgi:hypothetical protein